MKNISFDKNILYIGDKNIVFEDEPMMIVIMFFVILGKDEKYGR